MNESNLSRRRWLKSCGAALLAAQMPFARSAAAPAKYRRYNVASAEGQKALKSYAAGVEAMMKLPATDPRNWFRTAFIHLMDCPHGNWWFYVWHRGYIGFVERTIRDLSGDQSFALPYWDWTQSPQIPDGMFDGVLTPTGSAFEKYTGNLAVFTSFAKQPLSDYWATLSAAQKAQLAARGYNQFDDLWNDVTGLDVKSGNGISGNVAFATTCGSRYLSRDNPKLDPKTAYDVSPFVITSGLVLPTDFYNPQIYLSFTSSKTQSHNTAPGVTTKFSLLEALPHNKVHNAIGGVAAIDPGPYGNMVNFLSPVDPIFFLHHSNIDRLWDVWTRRQQHLGLPILPSGDDLTTFSNEAFLFFVDNGRYVTDGKAGNYTSTDVFDYDYEPGFGESLIDAPSGVMAKAAAASIQGTAKGSSGSVRAETNQIERHLASPDSRPMTVSLTVTRPQESSTAREFDVLVNAPPGVTQVSADSPYYAGTVAFFGPPMRAMAMPMDSTFVVPLPKRRETFLSTQGAAKQEVNIRIVPSQGKDAHAPTLKGLSLSAQ
jgi:tyrosinase